MAYVPNATTVTEPIESRSVESAALEFRTLKEYVVDLAAQVVTEDAKDLRVPESTVNPIPAVSGRAGKVLGFDAAGQPVAVAVAGTEDPSLRADLAAFSGSSLIGYMPVGAGAVPMTVQNKLRETVSVKDFGAVGDGVTDDTAALQAAIDYLMGSMTSPASFTNRGVGTIYLPRGKYLSRPLVIGTQVSTRPVGFRFTGDGEYATSIIYAQNTGTLFSFRSYNSVQFDHLSIIHSDVVNIAANRTTWTNICFDMNGTGGGRAFTLSHVTTHGFNKLLSFVGTGNNDTNFFTACTFSDGNIFCYSRNSEAVVNRVEMCTFGTEWNSLFDLGGLGHTTIESCNIVISGTVMKLTNANDSLQNSRYVIDNCKFEFYPPYGATTNSTTKIIDVADDFVDVSVDMRNCTLPNTSVAKAPAAGHYVFDIKNNAVKITAERCFFGDQVSINIDTGSSSPQSIKSYFKMLNCDSVPTPTGISFSGSGTGSVNRIPVSYVGCTGVNDVTLVKYTNWVDVGEHVACFSPRTGSAPGIIIGDGPTTYDYLLYGQNTQIDQIIVLVESTVSASSCSVSAYSDVARTNLIGTISIPNGTLSTPVAYPMSIPIGTVVSSGVYFTIQNTGGSVYGKVKMRYTCF